MAIRAYEAAIDGVGHVAELFITERADEESIDSSATQDGSNEIDGNTDWEGYYVQNSATPAYWPNDEFTLKFDLNQNTAGPGGHGDVIVQAVRVDWQFATGALIRNVVKFGATGPYTAGTDVAVDAGPPVPKPCLDGKIQLAIPAVAPTFSTLSGVRAASLYVYSQERPLSHSGVGGAYTRIPEQVAWQFALDMDPEDTAYPAAIDALNGNTHVRAFTDPTLYYDVQWIKWKRLGQLSIPIGSREYVRNWYVGRGASFVPIGQTWTVGAVTSPGGTFGDIWGQR